MLMTSVFVVFEYYRPAYGTSVYKNIEQAFASRRRAEEHVVRCENRNALEGLLGYSYEIEEVVFDYLQDGD